jgi:CDP-diacylglycerol--serine O-phosphatidyltransferase
VDRALTRAIDRTLHLHREHFRLGPQVLKGDEIQAVLRPDAPALSILTYLRAQLAGREGRVMRLRVGLGAGRIARLSPKGPFASEGEAFHRARAAIDGLKVGRVARLTKTQSAFGAEYDSLSDMVSFGAAPALVMYEWVLRDMGKLGWIAAFVYCAGTALRLARFNTMLDVADKRWFTGIPSPAAAALVAGCVFIADDYNIDPVSIKWWAWGVTVFAGLTMVSNLKYWSFKSINLKKSVPFLAIFLIVLAIALLSYQPAIVLFAGFVAYAISGYVVSGWQLLRRRRTGAAP